MRLGNKKFGNVIASQIREACEEVLGKQSPSSKQEIASLSLPMTESVRRLLSEAQEPPDRWLRVIFYRFGGPTSEFGTSLKTRNDVEKDKLIF